MAVAEISNHFTWDKYSAGLTAENNNGKKTDNSLGTFQAVMDVYVLLQGRDQEPKSVSHFTSPMLS